MLSREEFQQMLQDVALTTDLRRAYGMLLDLLQDLANTHTADSKLHFTSLFTQLAMLCRQRGIDLRSIDAVRRRAHQVLQAKEDASSALLKHDCQIFTAFSEALFCNRHEPIAKNDAPREKSAVGSRLLAVVTAADTVLTEHGDTWRIAVDEPLQPTFNRLKVGQTLCLLDCTVSDDVLRPRYIVVEPDFLLDISALAACVAYYGETPQNYLLRLLSPPETSEAIVLGNVANQFVDSVVNAPADAAPDDIRREALMKSFADAPLDFLVLDKTLGKSFVDRLQEQFQHIYEGIHQQFPTPEIGLQRDVLLLEPTLLCPALGLSGRLDIMSADGRTVVELKSGRARESTPLEARRTHRIQMLLYAEMMRRNFDVRVSELTGYLWYSRYPELIPQRRSYEAVVEALNLRNRIVQMMQFLADGGGPRLLSLLTPEKLNVKGCDDSVFHRFYRPMLERVCKPLQAMDDATRAYFCAFSGFLARELWVGKTTDGKPFSTRGFARTWTADAASKIAAGEMLANLCYCEIDENQQNKSKSSASDVLTFSIPEVTIAVTPSFRPGDAVVLYRFDKQEDTATNHPLYRAFVSEITASHLSLRLLYPQSARLFRDADARYAVEHDHMDVGVTNCFEGLWHFAATSNSRRDLLLGRRKPRPGAPQPVCVKTNPAVDDIVARALAAEDYFLLVGPPGTGKTSVALRALTLNFIEKQRKSGTFESKNASCPANSDLFGAENADCTENSVSSLVESDMQQPALLLTAYTNRAVDEICAMLESAGVDYIRIGSLNSCAEPFRAHLLSELVKGRTRRELRAILDAAPVVVGTVLTLSRRMELFRVKRFVLAVIDEASQILEPQLLTLLCATDSSGVPVVPRFVMVGDHKQLPAVVLQPAEQTKIVEESLLQMGLHDLRSSLFERLYRLVLRDENAALTATLTSQGRMHPDIAAYASEVFYGGRLEAVPLAHQKETLQFSATTDKWERFVASTRFGFVDVAADFENFNLKTNQAEARATAGLIRAVCELYRRKEGHFDAAARVGVIVPFRAQINCVRQALRDAGVAAADMMTIDTVECYQGSQRDIIVFCTTVSRSWQLAMISEPVDVAGTSVDRKLNVAVTRARLQFFLVGNAVLLRRSPLYARLIDACACFAD